MNLDTVTLECFLAVADTGSFTKAANKVCRSQSAVSQQIAKLEYVLDTALFSRGKDFSLTPDGEIFLGYARQISALHREALERFKEPDLVGEVRFGLPEDFASVFLSDVLAEFIRIHPRILLHVECDLTLNLYERFKNKEFDLVLVKMSRPEDFPNGHDVWSETLEWVGNPALLAADAPIALVLSPQPCVYRARAIEALEQMRRPWRIVFSSHSYAGTVAAVGANMGITVLPRNMIPKHLSILRQHATLPTLDDTHISLLKHAEANPATQSLEQFVIDKLRG
jgi:DNA-binding transcriptional LysR family regulator